MNNNPLANLSIASPCSANWNQMQGDERRRFCGSCKLHVHNLSGMTAAEATTLLEQAGQGRLCVRFFRRADGTVLTRDCPVGLRQKMRRAWARAAALWLALWGSATACVRGGAAPTPETPVPAPVPPPPVELPQVMGEVMGDFVPAPPVQPDPRELLGRIAPTATPPARQDDKK